MIVKNEEKTIKRLLESVIDQIDAIVISDTGSTDDTKTIANDFMESYPTKHLYWLPDIEFRDFGYNRTYSLKGCVDVLRTRHTITAPFAYILLLDADMVFKYTGLLTLKCYLQMNVADKYNIFQGSDDFYYYNTRIIRNTIWDKCNYRGVTHEYLNIDTNTDTNIDTNTDTNTDTNIDTLKPIEPIEKGVLKTEFFIEDIGDGGAKQDKFERDIRLLTKGLQDEPDNERYMFYLANSMKDAGKYNDAIVMYKQRIQAGRWFEEVWYSYYEMGHCYMAINDPDNAIISWLKALQVSDYRIENLYEICKYYCRICDHKLSYQFYLMAKQILDMRPQKDDVLFFKKNVYDYLLDFEFTICANYYNPLNTDVFPSYMKILNVPYLDWGTKQCLLNNLKYEPTPLLHLSQTMATTMANESTLLATIKRLTQDIIVRATADIDGLIEDDKINYINSTPTIALNNQNADTHKLYINVRFVNYRIDPDDGNYIRDSYVGTMNHFNVYSLNGGCSEYHGWLKYNTEQDNKDGGYVGLEDIRLLLTDNEVRTHDPFTNELLVVDTKPIVIYNCNRGLSNTGGITVECGLIVNGETKNETLFSHTDNNNNTEKNWVCFIDDNKRCKFIYKWGDNGYLTIADKQTNNSIHYTHHIKSPPFFQDLRGSTNGIRIGDEIWFICHLVNHTERRYYYHCFVVLHHATFEILRYSRLWTFEKQPVEYCLSFIHHNENNIGESLIIGYSIMDSTTKYMEVSMTYINQSLFYK